MHMLFVSREVCPLVKTGGLADVSAALSSAFEALCFDAQILMLAYLQTCLPDY
jgi:starch synthase